MVSKWSVDYSDSQEGGNLGIQYASIAHSKKGKKFTCLLAGASNRLIILVQHNTHLLHQADLFLIVPREVGAFPLSGVAGIRRGENLARQGGVDVGEESGDVLRRDPRGSRLCGGGTHLVCCKR